MPNLHHHYDQLTDAEREFVDEAFPPIFKAAKASGIRLNAADPSERAADALARWVIESCPKAPAAKPRYRVKALRDPEHERELESRAYWKYAGDCAP